MMSKSHLTNETTTSHNDIFQYSDWQWLHLLWYIHVNCVALLGSVEANDAQSLKLFVVPSTVAYMSQDQSLQQSKPVRYLVQQSTVLTPILMDGVVTKIKAGADNDANVNIQTYVSCEQESLLLIKMNLLVAFEMITRQRNTTPQSAQLRCTGPVDNDY
jgi:hypothetical protein